MQQTKRVENYIYESGKEQKGVLLLNPPVVVARDGRYVRYDNRIMCDCFDNREWYPGDDEDISWYDAEKWVRRLNVNGGGWRLPTIEQLKGLYRKNKRNDPITPLLLVEPTDVWSCEECGEASVWGFNFIPGNAFRTYRTYKSRFRALATRVKPRYR